MKDKSLTLLFIILLFLSTVKVYGENPPCKPEGESNCDWIEAGVIEFHLNPQIQGYDEDCENCKFFVKYWYRRCPIPPYGNGFYQDISITDIWYDAADNDCQNCSPSNLFLNALFAIWEENAMNFVKLCTDAPNTYNRISEGSCWRVVTVYVEPLPPFPAKTEIHLMPCEGYGCCQSYYTITFDSYCNITKLVTIDFLEVTDDCQDPCFFVCNQLVFNFQASQGKLPTYDKTIDMSEKVINIIINNLSDNTIILKSKDEKIESFCIYNLIGENVFTYYCNIQQKDGLSIDLQSYPKGMYHLLVKTNKNLYHYSVLNL
ncbi:MAG: T9SS type A sorting domain-containing protein [Candidatus Kapabacteria bacterium]|nr:T9SS type A sorting domain-containing protein [Candidatus Kapabacteria bacterium]